MKKIVQLLLVSLVIIGCVSEKKKSLPEAFDYGNTVDNVYSNTYFDMTIPLNEGWYVTPKSQMDALNKQGQSMVAGDNTNLEKALKANAVRSASLLYLYKHELGAPVTFNPSLLVIAENVEQFPGVKSGEDYLFHTENILKQTTMEFDIIDRSKIRTIGGNTFSSMRMDMTVATNNLRVQQEYMSRIEKGFALNFVISYINDEQKQELEQMLEKIEF